MSDELRTSILFILDAHQRSRSANVMSDWVLAEGLGQTVDEIQRQLEILELDDLVLLSKSHTSYGAAIKPRGTLLVEQLRRPPPDPPDAMGFRNRGD